VSAANGLWVKTGLVPVFTSGRKLRLKLIESRDTRIKLQSQIAQYADEEDDNAPDKPFTGEYESDYLKTISDASILILDDLGLESEKDWIHSRIIELLYYRHDENKTTIITTNLDYTDLERIYGKGVIARLDSRTNGTQFYITLKLNK
jgi:DNA replication protein DnaC